MYSFVRQPRTKTHRLIEVPSLESWRGYPYARVVGRVDDPDLAAELLDQNQALSMPQRLLINEKKDILLVERQGDTIDYHVIMILKSRDLAERLVRNDPRNVILPSLGVQIIAQRTENTPSTRAPSS